MFAGCGFVTYYGGRRCQPSACFVEGGDVHVIGNETVMIGMGERTTPMGAEMFSQVPVRLGTSGQGSSPSNYRRPDR